MFEEGDWLIIYCFGDIEIVYEIHIYWFGEWLQRKIDWIFIYSVNDFEGDWSFMIFIDVNTENDYLLVEKNIVRDLSGFCK